MTRRDRSLERHRAFEAAMLDLCRDPRFEHFIDAIRDYRETAIDSLSNSADIVKSESATLACIGEIAAYKSIIAIYDDFVARPPAGSEVTSEADLT